MKVTYNWLKDFVDIKIPAKVLADKLTMAGLEVTSLEEREGDFVFEIEITSNRPDWLSVIGVAREVAAITNSKFLPVRQAGKIKSAKVQGKIKSFKNNVLKIEVQNKKDCPLYTAKIIRGVRVGPSPDWMKKRLELVGCRSVNNIVDITNYILFEYGEPLHAFDLDRLSGNTIIVRRARDDEKIVTIDGIQRQLWKDILVIADKDLPVAVAGVMGGAGTEVTEATKNILLEAAIFSPVLVRRGRQKLGLQSESSYRFERGVDFDTAQNAPWQAEKMIREICGGELVLAKESETVKNNRRILVLDIPDVAKILGVDIPLAKIKNILVKLGFKVKLKGKKALVVSSPAHRQDIGQEIDLIEEVVRIYGYEKIPVTLPKVSPQVTPCSARDIVSSIKNILVALGLNEVITYSLIDMGLAKEYAPNSQFVTLINPLSREQGVLRSTLIPGLLKTISSNLNQKQVYVAIFEIASIFLGSVEKPQEDPVLGIALCGIKSNFAAEQGLINQEVGFLHLKGILETLLMRLGIANYSFENGSCPSEFSVYIGKDPIGTIAGIERPALEVFEIKNKNVVVAQIYLKKVISHVKLERKFTPLPIYPQVVRDISFILKDDVKVDDVLRAVKERGGSLLEDARIADYYQGRQIPAGFKGFTLSCTYRSGQRTLTEAEVNPAHVLVCAVLKDRFGAQLR